MELPVELLAYKSLKKLDLTGAPSNTLLEEMNAPCDHAELADFCQREFTLDDLDYMSADANLILGYLRQKGVEVIY